MRVATSGFQSMGQVRKVALIVPEQNALFRQVRMDQVARFVHYFHVAYHLFIGQLEGSLGGEWKITKLSNEQ